MDVKKLAVLAVAVAMATAACTTTPGGSPSAPASAGESAGASAPTGPVIKIGVDLPLSGGEVANGQPTLQGVELAVKQAN